MATTPRTGRIERTVTRIVAAGAVTLVVLAGTLGSTAAQWDDSYIPGEPSSPQLSQGMGSIGSATYSPMEPSYGLIPGEPIIPGEPMAPYGE